MKRECNCEDWKQGISSLNDMCFIGQIHGCAYMGRAFTFCPYCGAALIEIMDGEPNFCDLGD